MAAITISSDILMKVLGTLTGPNIVPGDNTVTNAKIGEVLTFDNLQHRVLIVYGQSNAHATTRATAADANVTVYEVQGATGTLLSVTAGSYTIATGDATVSIDVKKSTAGATAATVLSAPIVLNSTNTARVSEAGTLSVTALAEGDQLEIYVDATIGTGGLPTGLWVKIALKEDAE